MLQGKLQHILLFYVGHVSMLRQFMSALDAILQLQYGWQYGFAISTNILSETRRVAESVG
jgi:hypothetical protein